MKRNRGTVNGVVVARYDFAWTFNSLLCMYSLKSRNLNSAFALYNFVIGNDDVYNSKFCLVKLVLNEAIHDYDVNSLGVCCFYQASTKNVAEEEAAAASFPSSCAGPSALSSQVCNNLVLAVSLRD